MDLFMALSFHHLVHRIVIVNPNIAVNIRQRQGNVGFDIF